MVYAIILYMNQECYGYLKGCGCQDCRDIDKYRDWEEW